MVFSGLNTLTCTCLSLSSLTSGRTGMWWPTRAMAQSARRLHQCHEQVLRLYPITWLHIHFGNGPGALGHKLHFHLHGLNGQEWITFGHVLARLHHHRHYKPRHGSPDMGWIVLLDAGPGWRHGHTSFQ